MDNWRGSFWFRVEVYRCCGLGRVAAALRVLRDRRSEVANRRAERAAAAARSPSHYVSLDELKAMMRGFLDLGLQEALQAAASHEAQLLGVEAGALDGREGLRRIAELILIRGEYPICETWEDELVPYWWTEPPPHGLGKSSVDFWPAFRAALEGFWKSEPFPRDGAYLACLLATLRRIRGDYRGGTDFTDR